MKRWLVLSCLVCFFTVAVPASIRAEVLQPAQKQESADSVKSDQTARQASQCGLGLALGVRSTYFRLEQARRKIVGNLNHLEEEQDYFPKNLIIQAA